MKRLSKFMSMVLTTAMVMSMVVLAPVSKKNVDAGVLINLQDPNSIDPKFADYLHNEFDEAYDWDITTEDIKTITKFTIRAGTYDGINSLKGIEYFTELTSLEVYKLEQELKEVQELIARLTAIVNSRQLQFDIIKTEMLEIKKKYITNFIFIVYYLLDYIFKI